jgi:hypothetical protein
MGKTPATVATTFTLWEVDMFTEEELRESLELMRSAAIEIGSELDWDNDELDDEYLMAAWDDMWDD